MFGRSWWWWSWTCRTAGRRSCAPTASPSSTTRRRTPGGRTRCQSVLFKGETLEIICPFLRSLSHQQKLESFCSMGISRVWWLWKPLLMMFRVSWWNLNWSLKYHLVSCVSSFFFIPSHLNVGPFTSLLHCPFHRVFQLLFSWASL